MLRDKQSVLTEDPVQCAEMLNGLFHSQFQTDCMACDSAKIEVSREDMVVDLASAGRCLSMLYKASLNSDRPLQQWKVANVTPVYKGSDPESVNNYRPILLTNIP